MQRHEITLDTIADELEQMAADTLRLRDANRADILAFKIKEYGDKLRERRKAILDDIWQEMESEGLENGQH